MANMQPNMDFNVDGLMKNMIFNKLPKEFQDMPPLWAAGFAVGFNAAIKQERERSKKPQLDKIFPEYYAEKERSHYGNRNKRKNKNQSWVMTEQLLKERDQIVRDDLIEDVYLLINDHIIERYKLCYFMALMCALNAEGFGQKRYDRVVKNIEGQMRELGRYITRKDFQGVMKWCQRHDIDQTEAQKVFQTDKKYRLVQEIEIEDLDIFMLGDDEDKKNGD